MAGGGVFIAADRTEAAPGAALLCRLPGEIAAIAGRVKARGKDDSVQEITRATA
jgi:hypothetical protein